MTGDPNYPAIAEELRAAVGEFVRSVRVDDAIAPGQAAVLGYLDRGGQLSIADLARCQQVRHQSMTRTVNLLRDQGLVEVGAARSDRRQVAVLLAGIGRTRLAEDRLRRASGIARAVEEELDDEERAIVARIPALLRKLSAHSGLPRVPDGLPDR